MLEPLSSGGQKDSPSTLEPNICVYVCVEYVELLAQNSRFERKHMYACVLHRTMAPVHVMHAFVTLPPGIFSCVNTWPTGRLAGSALAHGIKEGQPTRLRGLPIK